MNYQDQAWTAYDYRMKGPFAYYFYKRRQGLKPRTAYLSVLMYFMPTTEAMRERANRVLDVIGR